MGETPFWKEKPLAALERNEWEALCDGCGKCCLLKVEDEAGGEVHYTNVACRYLDLRTCRCTDYAGRSQLVPDCLTLDPHHLAQLTWMPRTCAYRLLAEGEDLPSWHPLVSGDPESVHEAGVSVRAYAVPETALADPDDLQDHVMEGLG